MTIPEAFELALQHHQSGRLAEAEAIYRQVLAVEPRHPGALHLLGLIAHQVGRNDVAVDLIRQAIALNPNHAEAYSNLGISLHDEGRLNEAIAAYHRAISLKPDYFEAYINLGNALRDKGQPVGASAAYRQAVTLKPNYPEAHSNLGDTLRDQGKLDEAIAACRQAIALKPDFPEAYNNLGNAVRDKGHLDEAVVAYRQAIALRPNFPEAHGNLGNVLCDLGLLDDAITAYREAIILKPDFPEAYGNLGNALRDKGQLEEATVAYRQAIVLKPNFPDAHSNLGVALREKGQLEEAIAAFRQAVALKPNSPEIYNNLGSALKDKRQLEEAMVACHQAIVLKPDYPEAYSNLGSVLSDRGELDESIASYRKAIFLKPDYPEAHYNLGLALSVRGQLDEAIAAYRQAIALKPDFQKAHSNLIYTSLFHPAHSAVSLRDDHYHWSQRFTESLRNLHQPHANDRDPSRRLRVGYVSPDFSRHVISHFLVPLLERHEPAGFEIYCYASVKRRDAITERMGRNAAVWRDVLGMSDEALAAQIREDRIDLLVDLTQHMADNRLLVFARQPAPVQVAWLGYPGSTGLEAIGYRLTDAVLEPEGAVWAESVETPVRLPDAWFCFDPIDAYPEPGPLPALAAGQITFGSLNNFCKVNAAVLRLWVEVLRKVEGSRLLLQCPAGATQARMRQWFEREGIAASRLELVARTATRAEFLRHFARIDVALETFPYNGGTTTCEALWMGVPVPSFGGATAVARIGLSILSACGLRELIAGGPEDYVRLVASLAGDLPRLAALRATLRGRLQASAFMDAPRFARSVEAAYRAMWRQWCAQPTPGRAS